METSLSLVLVLVQMMSSELIIMTKYSPCGFYSRKLIEEVSVVFHSAATVKFDEDLTKAVKLNVVAVFTIMELCKKMKKLQESFVHF